MNVIWFIIMIVAAFLVAVLFLPISGFYAFPVLLVLAIVGFVILRGAAVAEAEAGGEQPNDERPDTSQGVSGNFPN
jgi:hypothetical protein